MYEFIGSIAHGTVPTPVAAAVGLFGLGAGLWWMRVRTADLRQAAIRTASAASTYWVRAEKARTYIHAIETPTQQVDVTELRRAHASRAERAREVVAVIGERVRDAVTPVRNPDDWAEGEMTKTFRKIMDAEQWEQPADASPWVSPIASGPAPAPTPPPAIVHAPRGPQTPPRWQDGGTPPPQRRTKRGLTPRDREWTFLGRVPDLELPEFPRPFRMPTPQQRLPHDPRRMAQLPADETRQWRTRTV